MGRSSVDGAAITAVAAAAADALGGGADTKAGVLRPADTTSPSQPTAWCWRTVLPARSHTTRSRERFFRRGSSRRRWTRGEADAACEWLDRAIAQNEDGLDQQYAHVFYDPIRDDPRSEEFLELTGTSKEQLGAIEFEVRLPQ